MNLHLLKLVDQVLMAMTSLLKASYSDSDNSVPRNWPHGEARDLWLSAGHGSLKSGLQPNRPGSENGDAWQFRTRHDGVLSDTKTVSW